MPSTTRTARPARPSLLAAGALAALSLGGLTACSAESTVAAGGEGAASVAVESSADACELSVVEAPAGTVTFDVTNTGDEVTEFYLYADGGRSVVGEVEDVGPQTTRTLTVDVDAGEYVTACKPGMRGDGIRAPFTVTG